MKKLLLTTLAISMIALVKVGATSVTVSYVSGYYAYPGGEFNVSPVIGQGYSSDVLVNGGYETFCISESQKVNPYPPNNVYTATIGAAAQYDVAYLYSQFAKGTLASYDYTPGAGREASAWALQNAIWYFMGFTSNNEGTLGATYVALAALNAKSTIDYGVNALDLTSAKGTAAQPQLEMQVPDGGTTVMLLGLAIAGCGLVSRKLRGCRS
jgi:VPDSG-CTERM motif